MVTLHLRRDTPVQEIIDHLDDTGEVQPWPNPQLGEGVVVKGIADGMAKCLAHFMENHTSELCEACLQDPCMCDWKEPIVEESSEYDPNRLLFTPAPPQIQGKQLQGEMELAEE